VAGAVDGGSPPAASKSDSPLAANIRYGYSQGWSFTPLDGKRPIRKRWQSAPRETLDEALGWAAEGNVGLRTGKVSGIVVIDVDPGGNIEPLGLPGTAAAATGRPQAFHLYYRSDRPLRNSSKKLGPHIDVKADGGQVVLPGSVHPDTGVVYAWIEGYEPWNVEIAELPAHIVELLCSDEAKAAPVRPAALETTPEPHRGPSPDAKTLRYAQRALQLELHNLCQATDGNYFDMPITNGIVEGLNNKAKVISHRCYGFRTAKNYILALYHCLGKLPEPEPVHRFL